MTSGRNGNDRWPFGIRMGVICAAMLALWASMTSDALAQRDLSGIVCIVFDVLRATSSMLTALAHGAAAIRPVADISEALAIRQQQPDVVLAGERDGLRIRADLTGGLDFDLGNSPREFAPEKVRGRTVVMTTTNGTQALRACLRARTVLIGAFLNLRALSQWVQREKPSDLLLVCSGTHEEAAYEDALAAGALCDAIWPDYSAGHVADSAFMACQLFRAARNDLRAAVGHARNGRRLLGLAELKDDVPACLQRDTLNFVAGFNPQGTVSILDRAQTR